MRVTHLVSDYIGGSTERALLMKVRVVRKRRRPPLSIDTVDLESPVRRTVRCLALSSANFRGLLTRGVTAVVHQIGVVGDVRADQMKNNRMSMDEVANELELDALSLQLSRDNSRKHVIRLGGSIRDLCHVQVWVLARLLWLGNGDFRAHGRDRTTSDERAPTVYVLALRLAMS